jgi:eukaryotic-like serine/threonine-protein kinase
VVEPTRTCLGNRYDLSGLLATGGMGQVWRAHDRLLGRAVAVKVLRSEYTGDPQFRARFRAEAHHAAALSHPNIAAVFDYGEEQTTDGSGEHLAYLVMELVEGESLSALLARTGPLSPEQTLVVLRQTAAALAVAHAAGVVHRDVKPGNVLVREDGTVKITDFGIAWSAGSVPLTQTGQVVGTAAYLSPEQAAGSHATPASDVYSLGMVGYECLTGHKAFDGDNSVAIAVRQLRDQPAPLPAEVPAGIRALIGHALVKDPAQRWADGAAFVAAIDDVRAGRSLPPVPHSDTQNYWLVPGGPLDAGESGSGGGTNPGTAGATPAVTESTPRPGAHGSTGAGRPRAVVAPPVSPRRVRFGRVLVPLLALLVGAGVAAAVLLQLDNTDTDAPVAAAQVADQVGNQVAGAATGTQPTGLVLDDADYLDRPVDDVLAEITALGLLVDRQPVTTADVTPGLVIAVSPSARELQPGTHVLVSYAVAPRDDATASTSRKRAPVESVVQPPASTGATTTPASPTPTGTSASGTTSPSATTTGGTKTSPPTSTPGDDGTSSSAPPSSAGPSTSKSSGGGPGDDPGNGSGGPANGSGDGQGNGDPGASS